MRTAVGMDDRNQPGRESVDTAVEHGVDQIGIGARSDRPAQYHFVKAID